MGLNMRTGCIMGACLLLIGCSGTKPSTLGVQDGMLCPCPDSPNCVSSFSSDKRHAMEPLRYTTAKAAAREKLLAVISSFKRAKVAVNDNDYVHVEFTSALFRFVDDVEFLLDDDHKVIHFRSASRLGYSDLGVNRRRMEKIRNLFYE